MRFRPPDVDWTPELRWVLFRSFGPSAAAFREPVDSARALELAERFDLAARIRSRTAREVLSREAGESLDGFSQACFANVASSLKMGDAARRLGTAAEELGIPIVFLKGAAIDFLRLSGNGARSYSDLDVLVPLERIPDFTAALCDLGWRPSEFPDSEHQEVPLHHLMDGMVEIHRTILGVRLPGNRGSLDAQALVQSGMTQPIPGFPRSCFAPSAEVLRAHAIVHGLLQHGSAPASYPLFRFLSDLADLGYGPGEVAAASRLLREVDEADLSAVAELLAFLSAPGPAEAAPETGPARDLLFHIVSGVTDERYRRSLKSSSGFFLPVSDHGPSASFLLSARKAIVLSNAQVDAIYGPPRSAFGYAARKLLRPFDLVRRYGASLVARFRSTPPRAGD